MCTCTLMFRKDLAVEHGINPIPLSPLHSLVSLLPCFLSPFGLELSLSIPDRSILTSFQATPALPCRSGSPRHRCNVSCPRAYVRETCFETRDTPTRSTQPRYVGDSLSLSSPEYRRRRRRQERRAARRRGSRDNVLVVPGVPPMNRSRVATCVRARKLYLPSFSLPSPRISPSLSYSLNVSVKVSGPTHRSRSAVAAAAAVAATTVAPHTTAMLLMHPTSPAGSSRTYTLNERERERKGNRTWKGETEARAAYTPAPPRGTLNAAAAAAVPRCLASSGLVCDVGRSPHSEDIRAVYRNASRS